MSPLIMTAVILALLGSALIGGVFFAFSSFVMPALARLPATEGIAAMQSINVVVLNASFLGAFMGTAAISLLVALLAIGGWGTSPAVFWLAGALLYLLGTIGVTGLRNVPLNDQLEAVPASDTESVALWEHYVERWTQWNTVRTAAAMGAALLFTVGMMRVDS